jgi:putative CocE/NonD family hydrolase
MEEPPIKLHVRGRGWRQEREWPLPGTEWVELHLRRLGGLAREPEPVSGCSDVFVQPPVEVQPQVATCDYLTARLDEPVEVVGPAALTLYAAIDSDDTNWMAALLDVDREGREVEITRGFLKASHRALDESRSEPWRPFHPHLEREAVEPGRIYEYRIELSPLASVFAAGHRIKLSLSCLDHAMWPPPDLELGHDHQPWHLCRKATVTHTIFHDRDNPSRLLLPFVG